MQLLLHVLLLTDVAWNLPGHGHDPKAKVSNLRDLMPDDLRWS